MIRRVSVWHGKDGYTLVIHDVKARRVAEEWLTGLACRVSRGYLCPLCLPGHWDWLFRAGWGRNEALDGMLDHSLGSFLFHLGQRDPLSDARTVHECPLSFEDVCEHFPESRMEWDDDGTEYVRGVMVSQETDRNA